MIGSKIAHYEITSHLSTGGMGEVYAARDTKLGRSVAIKCLPAAFAHDAERVAKLQREARVLAALNHTNIAAIYGLEESGGRHVLVMELVPGDTLADRIRRGPLPIREALEIAGQMTEALAAAHEKGILHRDLKPANIKVTQDGKVKVLDFGIAKILVDEFSNPESSNLDTATAGVSLPGVILGTAPYMSPEQARGKPLDKRTDIWAFGIVLFEMLTGERVFAGETATDVIGAIAYKEPQWESLPAETPEAIRRLLRRCLAKDIRHRLHDIGDARLEIEASSDESSVSSRPQSIGKHVWIVAALLTLVVAATTFMAERWLGSGNSGAPILWTEILPPKPFDFDTIPAPALSPDGRMLAFNAPNTAGQNVIWVRPLDSPAARALPGTEGSTEIFWSPDNRSLGFYANSKLQRVDLAGGAPQILADAPDDRGACWGKDGTILFVPTATTVHRIAASGGTSSEVTRLNVARQELIHGWPSFLPDQKHFLLWVYSAEKQNEGLYVGTLDSNELRPLLPVRTRAQYANGYLFFGRQGNLMAQRFDPEKLQLFGEALRVTEGLGLSGQELSNMAFSVTDSGSIAWWSGTNFGKVQPTWFDREGRSSGTIGEPGNFQGLTPSPDGKYILIESLDLRALTVDILRLDVAARNLSRLTFVNYWAGFAAWSADSRRVLFTEWGNHLDVVPAQGGAVEQIPFPGGTNSDYPLSWSPDGQNLLFMRSTPQSGLDLWILSMTGDHKSQPYLNTAVNEYDGRISPDGHWVAYQSDESGRYEVFVQSFPEAGNKKRISAGGGEGPMWRKDGRELYFVANNDTLMAASVTPGATSIEFSSPSPLFQTKNLTADVLADKRYAPSVDGQRFLILVPVEGDRPQGIHLIHNWKP